MLEGSPAAQLTDVDPRQLGKWIVESRIGAGGMGVVYKARYGDQIAAVKMVRPGLLDDPQVAARFAREAHLLRMVQDTHISQFLDEDINGMPAWLATEYIPGPNLRDAVQIYGTISGARWWELARGLAQALAVLEIHGIAHRDIKPANVIMAQRGPVLIDFGIAQPEDAASLTATGIVTGSPSWLSPEQVNLGEPTPASDVFSLGSLLAYAATGRPPFGQGATVAVLMNIQRNAPDLDGIDPTRRALLERMLDKDPAARPTAREVLQIARAQRDAITDDHTVDLRMRDVVHTTQPAIVPPPPPPAPQAWAPPRPAKRRSWPKAVAILVAAALAVLVGYFGFNAVSDSNGGGSGSGKSQTSGSALADAPPFPGSDQLRSGDWLLSRYSVSPASNGNLIIDGTVMNSGSAPASAELSVYYYVNGKAVAVATGGTGEVTPGGSAQIQLTSEQKWQPGQPVLLVQAD